MYRKGPATAAIRLLSDPPDGPAVTLLTARRAFILKPGQRRTYTLTLPRSLARADRGRRQHLTTARTDDRNRDPGKIPAPL